MTAQRDYVLSDAYVEQWARGDGKMVRPGEVLVVPVPSGADVAATAEPQVSLEDVHTTPEQTQPWVLVVANLLRRPAAELAGQQRDADTRALSIVPRNEGAARPAVR